MIFLTLGVLIFLMASWHILTASGRHAKRFPMWLIMLAYVTAGVFVFFGSGMTWGN